jgi:hypothetical protein
MRSVGAEAELTLHTANEQGGARQRVGEVRATTRECRFGGKGERFAMMNRYPASMSLRLWEQSPLSPRQSDSKGSRGALGSG